MHVHGLRQSNVDDGVPGLTGKAILPGEIAMMPVATHQPGTFILSPLVPELAPERNARGLNAILIVEEHTPAPVDHDITLAVSDWRADDKGALQADFLILKDTSRVGRLGNRLTANGKLAPDSLTIRPGARIRLRIVNVSNARVLPLKVSNLKAEVVAIDSTPCQPFDPLKRTVILSPSSRIDMILDAAEQVGVECLVEAKIGDGIPIFAFRTEGIPLPTKTKFPPLPDPGLPPAIRLQDAVRADVVIAGGSARDMPATDSASLERMFPNPRQVYTINGKAGGLGKTDGLTGKEGASGKDSTASKPIASDKRGRVLVLALTNKTAWPQVIAVHGHAFRLLHPFDDGWEPYFLDTLYLVPGTTARIALIAQTPGKWAIRSAIAEHLATGVSTWFEVV